MGNTITKNNSEKFIRQRLLYLQLKDFCHRISNFIPKPGDNDWGKEMNNELADKIIVKILTYNKRYSNATARKVLNSMIKITEEVNSDKYQLDFNIILSEEFTKVRKILHDVKNNLGDHKYFLDVYERATTFYQIIFDIVERDVIDMWKVLYSIKKEYVLFKKKDKRSLMTQLFKICRKAKEINKLFDCHVIDEMGPKIDKNGLVNQINDILKPITNHVLESITLNKEIKERREKLFQKSKELGLSSKIKFSIEGIEVVF
jgi:hypothetical protein